MIANKSAVTRQMQRRRLSASVVPCAATVMLAVLALNATPCLGTNMPQPPASEETAAQSFAGAARESSMTQRSSPTETSSSLLRGNENSLRGQRTTIEQVQVSFYYDLNNDCGLDAAIANEVDNTLKEGLIEATMAIANGIFEEEFGEEDYAPVPHSKRNVERPSVHLTDTDPVSIYRMFAMNAPSRLLRVYSNINVEVEMPEGDVDTRAVRLSIWEGMQASLSDGSFFTAVPSGAGLCPEF